MPPEWTHTSIDGKLARVACTGGSPAREEKYTTETETGICEKRKEQGLMWEIIQVGEHVWVLGINNQRNN